MVQTTLCCSADRPLSAEEDSWEGTIPSPNRYRTLLPFILEPSTVLEYIAANCTTQELGGPTRFGSLSLLHFGHFTGLYTHKHLGVNQTFNMCVDTFGGYEEFARCDSCPLCSRLSDFDRASVCKKKRNSTHRGPRHTLCRRQPQHPYPQADPR